MNMGKSNSKKIHLWTVSGEYPIAKNALTNGIVLSSEDSLGEGGILVIRVNVGSWTTTRGSLPPTPIPVCVIVRRVVRIRLAVWIVAAKGREIIQLCLCRRWKN